MLNPLHAARSKIGGGTQARLLLEHFVRNVAHLEGEARLVILPAADGEDFAANFPDMRSAPLDHIGRCGKRAAEFVELFIGHMAAYYGKRAIRRRRHSRQRFARLPSGSPAKSRGAQRGEREVAGPGARLRVGTASLGHITPTPTRLFLVSAPTTLREPRGCRRQCAAPSLAGSASGASTSSASAAT